MVLADRFVTASVPMDLSSMPKIGIVTGNHKSFQEKTSNREKKQYTVDVHTYYYPVYIKTFGSTY